jgi:hypothetical protein
MPLVKRVFSRPLLELVMGRSLIRIRCMNARRLVSGGIIVALMSGCAGGGSGSRSSSSNPPREQAMLSRLAARNIRFAPAPQSAIPPLKKGSLPGIARSPGTVRYAGNLKSGPGGPRAVSLVIIGAHGDRRLAPGVTRPAYVFDVPHVHVCTIAPCLNPKVDDGFTSYDALVDARTGRVIYPMSPRRNRQPMLAG